MPSKTLSFLILTTDNRIYAASFNEVGCEWFAQNESGSVLLALTKSIIIIIDRKINSRFAFNLTPW